MTHIATTTIPRFADTSCSQCGTSFGPGTHGFSHCEDHRAPEPAPAVLYIPQLTDGPRRYGKTYVPELRTGDMSKHTIVADIASSEHEDVSRILALDIASGTSWDASKDIAHMVLDVVLAEHAEVPEWCLDFLQEHLGVNYVRAAEREGRDENADYSSGRRAA